MDGSGSSVSPNVRDESVRKASMDESDELDSSQRRAMTRKRIPSDQWEAKRAIITKLYQEEKRSLKEVMDILERDYNFKATCAASAILSVPPMG